MLKVTFNLLFILCLPVILVGAIFNAISLAFQFGMHLTDCGLGVMTVRRKIEVQKQRVQQSRPTVDGMDLGEFMAAAMQAEHKENSEEQKGQPNA